jgi:hypothetical protein
MVAKNPGQQKTCTVRNLVKMKPRTTAREHGTEGDPGSHETQDSGKSLISGNPGHR